MLDVPSAVFNLNERLGLSKDIELSNGLYTTTNGSLAKFASSYINQVNL